MGWLAASAGLQMRSLHRRRTASTLSAGLGALILASKLGVSICSLDDFGCFSGGYASCRRQSSSELRRTTSLDFWRWLCEPPRYRHSTLGDGYSDLVMYQET